MKLISELLISTAKRCPDREAVVCGQERLSYRDLAQGVNGFVRVLLERGLGYQDRVAVFLPNSPLFMICFFALAKIGAIALTFNINYKEEELRSYLIAQGVKYIISDGQRKDICEKAAEEIPVKIVMMDYDFDQNDIKTKRQYNRYSAIEVGADTEALWQFSSGSTGRPKIAARTHFNIITEAQSISKTIGINAGDKVFCAVPLFHAYGFGSAMMASVYKGATLILIDRFHPREILDILEKERVTIFFGVPYMFSILADIDKKKNNKFDCLRYCFSAGISLPKEVSRKFYKKFGIYVRDLYGTTETGCISINLNEGIHKTLDSVGLPIKGTRIEVVLENSNKAKIGQIGEVVVKTPTCAQKYYLGNLTKPLLKRGSFYTGDLGKKDKSGNLYLTGRKTSFINVAGAKVDPREVEETLRKYPGVKEAAVVGSPDKLRGEIIRAFVVLNGRSPAAKDLLIYCRKKLADFKVPRLIEFRKELPRSSLGKILKGYLSG